MRKNILGETSLYQSLGKITRIGDFTWRVSDCEERIVSLISCMSRFFFSDQ